MKWMRSIGLAAVLVTSTLCATPIPRTVCVTYCSDHPGAALPLQAVEPIFHNLGYSVVYCDLCCGIPPMLGELAAIVDWFTGSTLPDPLGYIRWVEGGMDRGARYLSLGKLAFLHRTGDGAATRHCDVAALFRRLGLHYTGERTDRPGAFSILFKEPTSFDFERALTGEDLNTFYGVQSADARNRVYLALKRNDIRRPAAVGAVSSPAGGYAVEGALLYTASNGAMRWHINPHLFFQEALGSAPCVYDYWLAAAPDDFQTARIESLQDGSFAFSHYGLCRTVSLDESLGRPDLNRSTGIVGFEKRSGRTILYLAPADRARLFLTEHQATTPHFTAQPPRLMKWRQTAHRLLFTGVSNGETRIALGGYPPHAKLLVEMVTEESPETPIQLILSADRQGEIAIEYTLNGKFGVAILPVNSFEDRSP